MKLIILATLVAACSAANLNPFGPDYFRRKAEEARALKNQELYRDQPENYRNKDYYNYYRENSRARADLDRTAKVLRFESDVNPDGFHYVYDTENDIHGEETGVENDGMQVQGSYSYIGDDGKEYSARYTAGVDGFQIVADYIPTPPPIPPQIARALEWNAQQEAQRGVTNSYVQDGSYQAQIEAEEARRNKYNYNSFSRRLWDPKTRQQKQFFQEPVRPAPWRVQPKFEAPEPVTTPAAEPDTTAPSNV